MQENVQMLLFKYDEKLHKRCCTLIYQAGKLLKHDVFPGLKNSFLSLSQIVLKTTVTDFSIYI